MQPNVSENPTVCMCYGKKFQADSFGCYLPTFQIKEGFMFQINELIFFKKY